MRSKKIEKAKAKKEKNKQILREAAKSSDNIILK